MSSETDLLLFQNLQLVGCSDLRFIDGVNSWSSFAENLDGYFSKEINYYSFISEIQLK